MVCVMWKFGRGIFALCIFDATLICDKINLWCTKNTYFCFLLKSFSYYDMWLQLQCWRKNLMTMSIKLSICVALLVSCLVNTTTINLCSVFKWIGGKEGIERKNYFGYFINLFWLWFVIWNLIIPPPFKTTAVQGSRPKKWLSDYCNWKSCPRIVQYFPVLTGSFLSLKNTKWICWV